MVSDVVGAASPDLHTPIAIIGAGQLGTSLARALKGLGVQTVLTWSVAADTHARARAEAAGMEWLASSTDLSRAGIVFSAVTPQAAADAARTCAPSLAPDAVYVDLNSLGPREKKDVADVVKSAGRHFVDGAVLGAAADGVRMQIIVSGPDAANVAGQLGAIGLRVRAVGVEPGEAASIKIVRSVLAKGLEVLYVEALVAARRLGVEAEVLGTFCDWLDARPAAASAEILVTTHVLHAERRMHELDMSIATVRETGLEPVLAQAIRDRLAATAATGVAQSLHGTPPASLPEAVALLDAALARAEAG